MSSANDNGPDATAERHFLYVADPMCSWCYGFAPVISAVAQHFAEPLAGGRPAMPVRILVGGLRAGNTRSMRQSDKDYIRAAWSRVAATSGQPFDVSFFDRDGFVYDTEPACRAVVAMRRRHPDRALDYMSRISRAFYAEGQDTTALDVLAGLAAEFGFAPEAMSAALQAPETREETVRDFVSAGEAGIEGFPTLLASRPDGAYVVVTSCYRPLAGLIEAIETWLSTSSVPAVSG